VVQPYDTPTRKETIMQTQANASTQLPAVAAVITHAVENYETWKRAFDAHAGARRAAGITATHINRDAEDPNLLSVYLAGTDAAQLKAFLSSTDLMATMRAAGVKGPPHIAAITPVEDLTVKDRPLAGAVIRHEVREYAAWKRAYDAHADARARAGVIGHAVNRSVENPNVVVIYLQAESLDALRAFVSSSDVKQVMQAAGVIGAPDIRFGNGGTWER
jgi:quinol monooxygenase YgiN